MTTPLASPAPDWIAHARGGMVAADHASASEIGAAVLRRGGNAFDAAIATSLALGIARPYGTGLTGGGFLLAWHAESADFVVLDFRETAPAGAAPQRYADALAADPDGPPPAIFGGNAVGVPGLLAGLVEINRRFGARPFAELVEPAIALAQRGVPIDADWQKACRHIVGTFARWPQMRRTSGRLAELFLVDGAVPPLGTPRPNSGLADALRLIATRGPQALYDGPIGAAIVQATQAAGGTLTAADLRDYRPAAHTPLRMRYGPHELALMPPPSSSGACLVLALHILAELHARHGNPADAAARQHLRIEALKHAFADRARWLGGAGGESLDRLLDPEYAATLAARLDPARTHAPPDYGTPAPHETGGTSHHCAADSLGNVVAMTETINGTWGSFVVAEPYGLVLNNTLDDFLTVPGRANLFGLQHGTANLIRPGARPLSCMAPTIVRRAGRPMLALGGSGGPRIISSVLHVLLNVLDDDDDLAAALDAPRAHHQWQPDAVYFDRPPPEALAAGLRARGHTVSNETRTGVVQALALDTDGRMTGGSDPRKGGRPAGV